jgi:hypothetical protein
MSRRGDLNLIYINEILSANILVLNAKCSVENCSYFAGNFPPPTFKFKYIVLHAVAQGVHDVSLPPRPRFDATSFHVGFMADKVALGRISPNFSVLPLIV